ncbi:MAG: ATP-dependent RNA helicase [Watsoniomyces obsoletus]|nr:MAG: ATP-dependent RNA helicase [Watsoniomyces obsoletus]
MVDDYRPSRANPNSLSRNIETDLTPTAHIADTPAYAPPSPPPTNPQKSDRPRKRLPINVLSFAEFRERVTFTFRLDKSGQESMPVYWFGPVWAITTVEIDVDREKDWEIVKNAAATMLDPAELWMVSQGAGTRTEEALLRIALAPLNSEVHVERNIDHWLIPRRNLLEDRQYRALDWMSRDPPTGDPTGDGEVPQFNSQLKFGMDFDDEDIGLLALSWYYETAYDNDDEPDTEGPPSS